MSVSLALVDIAALTLGSVILIVLLIPYLKNSHRRDRSLKILKINQPSILGKHFEFFQTIEPPFTLEIAVHHIGKKVNYYLLVPKRSKIHNPALEEVKEYSLYHHGGHHLSAYLRGPKEVSWSKLDLKKFDFSKVNEIGEGVVIQLLVSKRRRRKSTANLRVLISAPSAYQAKEILAALEPAFPDFKMIEAVSRDFIHKVNTREFSDKEAFLFAYRPKPLRR